MIGDKYSLIGQKSQGPQESRKNDQIPVWKFTKILSQRYPVSDPLQGIIAQSRSREGPLLRVTAYLEFVVALRYLLSSCVGPGGLGWRSRRGRMR